MPVRKVAIFPFTVHFTENQILLDLVWSPGDRKIYSIHWEIGEKAVISVRGAKFTPSTIMVSFREAIYLGL